MPFGATPNSKQRPLIPLHAGSDDKRRKRFARQASVRERVREILLARKTRSLPSVARKIPIVKQADKLVKIVEARRAEKAPIPAAADDREKTTATKDVQALVDAANKAIHAAEAEDEKNKPVLPPAPPEADKGESDTNEEPLWKRQWALEGAPGTDSDALMSAIRNLAGSTPVVVFSKTTCPYSSSAKTILSGLKMYPDPFIVEVDQRSDTGTVKNALTDLTHHSTFPNIFIGGRHIGGADDLHRLALDSKLVPMLIKAGVTFRKA